MPGTNQTNMVAGRSVDYHGNKGRTFRLALLRTGELPAAAER